MDRPYFQRLSLDDTLSRTVEVYTKGFVVFNQIGIVFMFFSSIISAVLIYVLRTAFAHQFQDPETLSYSEGAYASLVIILVTFLIGAIGNGAYVRAVCDIYLQRQAILATCILVGFQHAGPILAASLLVFASVLLVFICLHIPGINLMVQWLFVNPIIEMEGQFPMEALKSTWDLISGTWGPHMNPGIFLMVIDFVWHLLLGINEIGSCDLISLYIPGIYLIILWFLFSPIIVVEGLGAVEALKRSWALVSGSWCYVFCTYLILGSFLVILSSIGQLVSGINVYSPMGIILGSILSTIVGPTLVITMSVMCINLRVEKEGLNTELFPCSLGGGYINSNCSTVKAKGGPYQEEPFTSNIAHDL